MAWRESYVPNTNQRTSYKLITQGNFELVMARVKNYLHTLKGIKDDEYDKQKTYSNIRTK